MSERWPSRRDGDLIEEKLALLIGWRCHQAADRRFKPVYRELEPEHYLKPGADNEFGAPSEIRVLHDVVVFREVYGGGQWPPFGPATLDARLDSAPASKALEVDTVFESMGAVCQRTLPGGGAAWDRLGLDAALLAARHPSPVRISQREYLDYLRAVDVRCQIELHTLDPEESDIHAWLEGIARWHRESRSDMAALAETLAKGAAVNPALYRHDGPVFRLAESVRRTEPARPGDPAAARAKTAYGRGPEAAPGVLRQPSLSRRGSPLPCFVNICKPLCFWSLRPIVW